MIDPSITRSSGISWASVFIHVELTSVALVVAVVVFLVAIVIPHMPMVEVEVVEVEFQRLTFLHPLVKTTVVL